MRKKKKDYVLIELTRGLVTAISPEDEERVRKHTWHATTQQKGKFVAMAHIRERLVYLHRFLLKPPKNKDVDHWNGETLDNRRRCNLRTCSRGQNLMSGHYLPKNGYYGIAQLPSGKWRALITHKRKNYYLGSFTSKKTAAKAYDEAARRLHGKFAKLNFPRLSERPPESPKIIRTQTPTPGLHYSPQRRARPKPSPYFGLAFDKRDKRFCYKIMYQKKQYCGGYSKSAKKAALARDDLIIKNGWPHPLNFPKRRRRK